MTRAAPLFLGLALICSVALLAVFDRQLSALLPSLVLTVTGLDKSPIQFVPLLVIALTLAVLVGTQMRRIAGFEAKAILILLIAAQLNGLSAGPLDMFDLALFGVVGLWLGTRALEPDRGIALPPVVALGGCLVALSVAHLMVASPVRWFIGTFGITRAVLVAFIMVDLCRDRKILNFMINAMVVVAAASALFGAIQFALAYFGITYFTLIQPAESAFKPTPLGFVMRASALSITAQHYASFLVLVLPFLLLKISDDWRLRDVGLFALFAVGILVSWNFGAFLAAAVVCLSFPLLRWHRHWLPIILGVALLTALGYFSGLLELAYDLSFGDNGVAKGVDQRKTLFELGIDKVMRNPFIGTGPQAFASGDGNFWGRPVHNAFGQAAAELGIFASFILLAIVLYLLVSLGIVAVGASASAGPAAAAFSMVLGFLMLMQSEPNLDHSNTWMSFGLAQAILLIHRRLGASSGDQSRQRQQAKA